MATGLTVEELRGKLEGVLLKFYRPPVRVIVIPLAYHSKKYSLLGSVTQNGVFLLDQPVTIVEAIAKAQGFTAAGPKRGLPMVDLSRSFLMRKAEDGSFKKVDLDFEALFLQGDFEQNKSLAPDDFLYFPPLDVKEVYVLGVVRAPGAVAFEAAPTAVAAIAAKGGFGEKAYRSKILIVRGSLTNPQTITFNANDVLAAKSPDFKLEPRDIIYVSRRPWAFAEELLEAAITDFMRAAIITYTGQHVGPFIKEPLIK
jgi:polysaccharide export outer membrane protein